MRISWDLRISRRGVHTTENRHKVYFLFSENEEVRLQKNVWDRPSNEGSPLTKDKKICSLLPLWLFRVYRKVAAQFSYGSCFKLPRVPESLWTILPLPGPLSTANMDMMKVLYARAENIKEKLVEYLLLPSTDQMTKWWSKSKRRTPWKLERKAQITKSFRSNGIQQQWKLNILCE